MNEKKPLILVADDSQTMRSLLNEILTNAGYEVALAEDGMVAAIKAFELFPDLIISDIEMPQMNGYQVCRLLKSNALFAQTPVIILTSLDSKGAVFWGYQTGADLYLTKDFKAEDLLTAISDLFRKYQKQFSPKINVKPVKIDALQISEMLNDYLDARLFEMTLINEINKATLELTSVSDTLSLLLETIQKVYESYCAGFAVFTAEKEIRAVINNAKNLSEETVNHFSFHLLQDLALLVNEDISDYKIELEVIASKSEEAELNMETEADYFISYPIRVKEENLGVLNIMHPDIGSIQPEKKLLLNKLVGYFSAAISAILMYHKIKDLSIIDGLTQIYNRRHIMELFKIEFSKVSRHGSELSVLMLDIDDFKKINDHYGHLSGDLVLKGIAAIIKSSIRNIDLPGRYGGEEFFIILPDTSKEKALIVAERIRKEVSVNKFKIHSGEQINATISIGLSCSSELSGEANEIELIRIADMRLYQAKKGGKDRVVFQ